MRSLAFGFKDVIFRYKKEKEFIDVLRIKGGVGSWLLSGLENRRSLIWVASSNLVSSAKIVPWCNGNYVCFWRRSSEFESWWDNLYSSIAQLVEHLICNQEVAGSMPVGGSIKMQDVA